MWGSGVHLGGIYGKELQIVNVPLTYYTIILKDVQKES